jgi:alanyl-tRNA synthetase
VTARLYYTDADLCLFDATVVSCTPRDDGLAEVVLDRTAFYPTSGGQPFDTGRLGGLRVLDVVDRDDGGIAHVVDGSVAPGAVVRGEIDWPRRFDHMQQHTGQHVLSAAFERATAARTVSFHLGAESSTIDLDRDVSADGIDRAEAGANDVVWTNRPVTVRFVDEAEAARLPLRKEPRRAGTLRLVEIPGCDLSACGGTHVAATGAVGLIAIAGWERFKGGTRVSFVCGGRARRAHARLRDIVAGATRRLSIGAAELEAAIDRLQAEVRDEARLVRRLQEELAAGEARVLRGEAEPLGGVRGVLRHEPTRDAAAIKALAAALVSEPGLVAVLCGSGQPMPIVVARSTDVGVDAGAIVRALAGRFGGRGGGRPELAQGGVTGSADVVLAHARALLSGASG